jgi:hypothetical protein
MPNVVCPRCGTMMTVSDWAPMVLTCRNCLGRVENPHGVPPGTPIPTTIPRRVIPIEQQVAGDTRLTSIVLFALASLFAAAAVLSFQVPTFRRMSYGIGVVSVMTFVIATLQLIYPDSRPIAAAADVFGKVGKIILAIILILACVVALLIGACFVLIAGSGIR